MSEPQLDHPSVYGWLFAQCPIFRFPLVWDFLSPDPECRGTITDPEALLEAACEKFPEPILLSSRVLRRLPSGALAVNPAVCNPVGAIIALREQADQDPYELLTARGCLSGREPPVLAVRRDAWTKTQLAAEKTLSFPLPCDRTPLFLTPRIAEVVLLRALGYAATSSAGMSRLGLAELRAIATDPNNIVPYDTIRNNPENPTTAVPVAADEQHLDAASAKLDDTPDPATSVSALPTDNATVEDPPAAPVPPPHVMVGWRLLEPVLRLPPYLITIAAALDAAERNLNLDFRDVHVWHPYPDFVEKLIYRLRFRDASLVQKLVGQGGDDCHAVRLFVDAQTFAALNKNNSPSNVVEAFAHLRVQLSKARGHRERPRAAVQAQRIYDNFVQSDLIAPLQSWAMEHDDPLERSTGMLLASIWEMIHRMSVELQEFQECQLSTSMISNAEQIPIKAHRQFMQMYSVFQSLVTTMQKL